MLNAGWQGMLTAEDKSLISTKKVNMYVAGSHLCLAQIGNAVLPQQHPERWCTAGGLQDKKNALLFAVLMQNRPLHELFLRLIKIHKDLLQRQDRETSSLINTLPGCQWFLVREDVALITINDCKIVVIWISAGVLLPNPGSVGMLINWFIVKSN